MSYSDKGYKPHVSPLALTKTQLLGPIYLYLLGEGSVSQLLEQ